MNKQHAVRRRYRPFHLLLLLLLACLFLPLPTHAAGFPIIGTLHSGGRPEAVAVDTQTHLLYIANESPGAIVAFDPIRGIVRWHAQLGDIATDVQVDSSSHHVYVTSTSYQNKQSTLSVLNGATGQILAQTPVGSGGNGIALDTKLHRVYVVSRDNGTVNVFSFLSGWQTGAISLQASQLHIGIRPEGIGVNSRLGRLYVADSAHNKLYVIDEANGHILTTLALGAGPLQPVRVDEATGRVYVVCSAGQELDVIDGNTNRMLARIPVKPYPEGVDFNTATGRIYVAGEGNNESGSGSGNTGTTITVIDSQSFAVLGTLAVGRNPDGVAADPALARVYVALEGSNAVVEVADSTGLPLQVDTALSQQIVAHHAIVVLQQATVLTLLVMLLTIVWSTLAALSPRWRAKESLQTPRDGASSRSEKHSLPR